MKTLANCTPREFLMQTNRIRKAAARWLELTGIREIRRRLPVIPEGASEAERQAATEKQVRDNAAAMLEAALEKCPEETAELMGLVCFIEPEELDDHSMAELYGGLAELLRCPEALDFFTSLAWLGRRVTAGAARR